MCGGHVGIVFSLPSSTGMVGSRCCHPLGARSHTGVVLGKELALLPGGSCWWRQLWLCAPSKSYSISCLPNHPQLQPQPQPNGPEPKCNPCFSQSWNCMRACVCVCVCLPEVFGSVRRTRPIALASADVTGLKECEECGGATAGVSIFGPGQKGEGQLGISRQLHSPGLLPG